VNLELGPGDYFADRKLELWRGGRDVESLAKHRFGLVEKPDVFAEEGNERLASFDFVA